jgi:hypothetical protein
MVMTVLGLLRSTTRCGVGGMWHAVRVHIEGRNAVRFERERRATLLTVPYALPPSTHLYEQRPDGSVLRLQRGPYGRPE